MGYFGLEQPQAKRRVRCLSWYVVRGECDDVGKRPSGFDNAKRDESPLKNKMGNYGCCAVCGEGAVKREKRIRIGAQLDVG